MVLKQLHIILQGTRKRLCPKLGKGNNKMRAKIAEIEIRKIQKINKIKSYFLKAKHDDTHLQAQHLGG
jgi:hypothetical protein